MTKLGAYIFGCSGERLKEGERRFYRDAQPWGFILFGRNIDNPSQLHDLTKSLRDAVGRDAPIFIDQEGGRVARMASPHWREWLPVLDQVEQGKKNILRGLYLRYRLIASELRAVGIDANCAPVADIVTSETHAVIKNRCLGDDVVKVAERAAQVAQGLIDGGVMPVMKHIPGHGRSTQDSHLVLPHVKDKAKLLRRTDFMAFEALSWVPMGMAAHLVYDDIDPDHPATQSPILVDYIRRELGFDGLLMTDDIGMHALSGPFDVRTQKAQAAGCDMVLHCNGDLVEMAAVAGASHRLEGRALERADHALGFRNMGKETDVDAMDEEFFALMANSSDSEAPDFALDE